MPLDLIYALLAMMILALILVTCLGVSFLFFNDMEMKNVGLIIIAISLFVWFFGYLNKSQIKQEAINAGVAEYRIVNNKKVFGFIEPRKEIPKEIEKEGEK